MGRRPGSRINVGGGEGARRSQARRGGREGGEGVGREQGNNGRKGPWKACVALCAAGGEFWNQSLMLKEGKTGVLIFVKLLCLIIIGSDTAYKWTS